MFLFCLAVSFQVRVQVRVSTIIQNLNVRLSRLDKTEHVCVHFNLDRTADLFFRGLDQGKIDAVHVNQLYTYELKQKSIIRWVGGSECTEAFTPFLNQLFFSVNVVARTGHESQAQIWMITSLQLNKCIWENINCQISQQFHDEVVDLHQRLPQIAAKKSSARKDLN